eukprot:gene9633-8578_t
MFLCVFLSASAVVAQDVAVLDLDDEVIRSHEDQSQASYDAADVHLDLSDGGSARVGNHAPIAGAALRSRRGIDADPDDTDSVCTVTKAEDSATTGTLRDCLQKLSDGALAPPDGSNGRPRIHFDISNGGEDLVIKVQSLLPSILTTVTIDGTTQGSSDSTTPPIVIDGAETSGQDGFGIGTSATDVVIKGVVIRNFPRVGILALGPRF